MTYFKIILKGSLVPVPDGADEDDNEDEELEGLPLLDNSSRIAPTNLVLTMYFLSLVFKMTLRMVVTRKMNVKTESATAMAVESGWSGRARLVMEMTRATRERPNFSAWLSQPSLWTARTNSWGSSTMLVTTAKM